MATKCRCRRLAIAATTAVAGLMAVAQAVNMDKEVTTAVGPGADAHVHVGSPDDNFGTAAVLDVKTMGSLTRILYLKFDLSAAGSDPITNAVLRFESTYCKADCTLGVYGLTNQVLDAWSESTITWNNAPGISGSGPDPSATEQLATFVLPGFAAPPVQAVTVSNAALTAFLNADTNGVATLMIHALTGDVHSRHASKENTDGYLFPTLSLTIDNRNGTLITIR